MIPLKITAKLYDGRVNSNDGLFNLDSILSYAWMEENHPDQLRNGDIRRDGLLKPSLPLRVDGDGRYSTSSGFYYQYSEMVEYFHKRFDDYEALRHLDFQGKRGKVNTVAGDYKAYRVPQLIRVVGDIVFYAFGDRDEVKRLLSTYIFTIGKKGSQGQGVVAEWVVEEFTSDWTEKGPYGIMRPTPFVGVLPDDGEVYQIRKFGIRPPYWLPENTKVCMIPNVRRDELAPI